MPTKVTIDSSRITQVNGKPFFLIGARHMPEGGTPEMLRDAGFNAFRRIAFGHESGSAEEVPRQLEGIYFWLYLYNRADFSSSQEHEKQLRDLIEKVKGHDRLLCYENLNEPTLLYKSDRFKAQPEELARGSRLLRELDPDHPIWLAHSCTNTVDTLRRFNDCADIIGCNPYPVYVPSMRSHIGVRPDGKMLDGPDQSIHAVGKYTEKMKAVGQDQKPVWMLIQAMANEHWFNPNHTPELEDQTVDESKVLYPTFEQMRFMAYDAVVSGATGLALAMWKTPTEGQIWQDIKCLVGELSELHDALCAPPVKEPVEISYTDLGFTVWDGVRVLARRLENDIYLYAVNTQFDPAHVTIRMKSLEGTKSALVMHEDREVEVENGGICDRFEPYDVHIYRIEAIC